MWQRQIQRFACPAATDRTPIGCGSWTMITSQSSLIARPFSSLTRSKSSHCSSLSVVSSPCSALWRSLVALKNSSWPMITCQCVSSPTLRISGTSV